ncbi:unnamed protein product [Amoebophrya sp. A25]|nr:unnamed protein product [Amoebophrya sp. A25]|eukprot:GSA25T00004775001.1
MADPARASLSPLRPLQRDISLSNRKTDCASNFVQHVPLILLLSLLLMYILLLLLARLNVAHTLAFYIPAVTLACYMLLWMAYTSIYAWFATGTLMRNCDKLERKYEMQQGEAAGQVDGVAGDGAGELPSIAGGSPAQLRAASKNGAEEDPSPWLGDDEELLRESQFVALTPELERMEDELTQQGVLHFAIIPNYKEDKEMMSETIDALAAARGGEYAKGHLVLVLAMEQRAGEEDNEKAKELVEQHKEQFVDIIVNFHAPGEFKNEVAGKSSNQQSAYLKIENVLCGGSSGNNNYPPRASRGEAVTNSGGFLWSPQPTSGEKGVRFIPFEFDEEDQHKIVKVDYNSSQQGRFHYDPNRTFITILDADSILHRDYFPELARTALAISPRDRSWRAFQSAVFPFRNLNKVPGLVRASSYAHYIVEIGTWFDPCFPKMIHSTYSLPLELVRRVEGWDVDLICEDHHMFLKCFCESFWLDEGECGKNKNITATSSTDKTSGEQEGGGAVREGDEDLGGVEEGAEQKPLLSPASNSLNMKSKDPSMATASQDQGKTGSCCATSRMQTVCIDLPTLGYTVEAVEDTPNAHINARFGQAMRHYYFLTEWSYLMLQHMKLAGNCKLSLAGHLQLFRLELYIVTMLIFTPLYAIVILLGLINVLICFVSLSAAFMNLPEQAGGGWTAWTILFAFSPGYHFPHLDSSAKGQAAAAFILHMIIPVIFLTPSAIVTAKAVCATLEGKFCRVYHLAADNTKDEKKQAKKKGSCPRCGKRGIFREQEHVSLKRDAMNNVIGETKLFMDDEDRSGNLPNILEKANTAGEVAEVVVASRLLENTISTLHKGGGSSKGSSHASSKKSTSASDDNRQQALTSNVQQVGAGIAATTSPADQNYSTKGHDQEQQRAFSSSSSSSSSTTFQQVLEEVGDSEELKETSSLVRQKEAEEKIRSSGLLSDPLHGSATQRLLSASHTNTDVDTLQTTASSLGRSSGGNNPIMVVNNDRMNTSNMNTLMNTKLDMSTYTIQEQQEQHEAYFALVKKRSLTEWGRFLTGLRVFNDFQSQGINNCVIYGVIPCFYVCFRLSFVGHVTEYVVAEKGSRANTLDETPPPNRKST